MAEWYQIKARIISQKGHAMQQWDQFIIGDVVPTGMCAWAFYTLFPFVSGLQSGDSFHWEKDSDKTNVDCPDAENPVVFELRRIK